MSSIPDEVVAELRSGHAGKGTSEDAPKKKNIVQVFRPQNSKSGNRRPGGSRSGNGQNTQGTSRQDRPAGGRNGQRPASGQNGSRQERPARGPQANGERENRRPQEGRPAGNRRPEEGQRGGFRQNRPADGRNGQRPSSAPNGQRGNRRQDEGARNGQRPDSRRNDRNDRNDRNSIPSPLVEHTSRNVSDTSSGSLSSETPSGILLRSTYSKLTGKSSSISSFIFLSMSRSSWREGLWSRT